MVIKVPKSKNDQLRRGDEVVISELPSPACPVKLLKKYLAKFQIPPDSRDLIFRPISKGKDSCKLITHDKPISYSTMRQAFRRDLKTIGADLLSLGCTLCVPVVRLWQLTGVSVTEYFSDTAAGSQRNLKTCMLTTIWIKDFLSPNFLDFKPCKFLVLIYHAFAQFFVTLYRGGSRQALPK